MLLMVAPPVAPWNVAGPHPYSLAVPLPVLHDEYALDPAAHAMGSAAATMGIPMVSPMGAKVAPAAASEATTHSRMALAPRKPPRPVARLSLHGVPLVCCPEGCR